MDEYIVFDETKRIILENVETMISAGYCSDEEITKMAESYIESLAKKRLEGVESLILHKNKVKNVKNISERTESTCDIVANYNSIVAESLNDLHKKRTNVKGMVEYKEFQSEMKLLMKKVSKTDSTDVDADVVETSDMSYSMLDPWTKTLMRHPVRNIKCGHHYDRDSVNCMIKSNFGIKCPVVGCASKIYIQPNHLESDLTLLEKINEHQRQLENQVNSSSDDDE